MLGASLSLKLHETTVPAEKSVLGMTLYCSYYERSRTHLSLDKDTPIPRPVTSAGDGAAIVAIPEVGGLHHRYERRAA
jgi:putative transposase